MKIKLNVSNLINIVSYFFPLNYLRKITITKDSVFFERLLLYKYIRCLARHPEFIEEVNKTSKYIEFKNDYNEFSVFNMCYMSDMLAKALFAVSINMIPCFSVLDIDSENYFDIFFKPIKYENKTSTSYKLVNIEKNTGGIHWFPNHNEIKAYSIIYNYFFKLKDNIENNYQDEWNRIKSIYKNGGGMLYGCVVRGTDYLIKKPKGHPVQPRINDVISTLKNKLKENDYIYLATDEKRTLDIFQNSFPGRIITSKSNYYDGIFFSDNINISEYKFDRNNDKFLRGFEYFERIYILSLCDAYIGGMSGASRMAQILNNNQYSYSYYFNLGLYK